MMSVEKFNITETESEPKTETKDKPKPKEKKESPLLTELRQYQSKTIELFTKEGLELPNDIAAQKRYVDDFVRKVKKDKGPIQKIITTMKRMPKVVRNPKTGKAEKIDYLEVHSELRGYDWKNNPLSVTDYYEGFHYEPVFHTVTKGRDDDTGDLILEKQHRGINKIYDIALSDKNRLQIITDIINLATGTYRDEILFYYQVPDSVRGSGHRDGNYTFDQFLNSSPEEMENLAWTRPLPLHANKDRIILIVGVNDNSILLRGRLIPKHELMN